MKRDSQRLVDALRAVNTDQWLLRTAATILAINGIDAALAYVADANKIVPMEVAEAKHIEDMENKP